MPEVSVLIPVYNVDKYLPATLGSLTGQTFGDFEVLCVDNGSTDGSLAVLKEYAAKDSRIKIIEQDNRGVSAARNAALDQASGEYIAFLDSDDLWLPEKLEKQVSFMRANNCDFCFTEYEHIDEDGNSLNIVAKVIKHLTYTKMLLHCWPGCLTVMYNQEITGKITIPDIKKNNDHALFLRVLTCCSNACGIPELLAKYRIRKGSISRKKFEIIQYYIKTLHEFEKLPYFFSLFCVFTHMFIKFFFKYRKKS